MTPHEFNQKKLYYSKTDYKNWLDDQNDIAKRRSLVFLQYSIYCVVVSSCLLQQPLTIYLKYHTEIPLNLNNRIY